MKVLCLDSTAKVASCAILDGECPLAEYTVMGGGRSHSELLLPMIRSLLSSVGLTEGDIDLFAVSVGPGSFTGVRIGVALMKGLAFATEKPCAAVSSLEALAEVAAPLDGILCPVMDARRNQLYNALFRYENGVLRRLTEDRAIGAEELAAELAARYGGEPCRLIGDGYEKAEEALLRGGITPAPMPTLLRTQRAAAVGRCGIRLWQAGEVVSDENLRPIYLRLPQAERERLERIRRENENKKESAT